MRTFSSSQRFTPSTMLVPKLSWSGTMELIVNPPASKRSSHCFFVRSLCVPRWILFINSAGELPVGLKVAKKGTDANLFDEIEWIDAALRDPLTSTHRARLRLAFTFHPR
jgi:hypothetical protein